METATAERRRLWDWLVPPEGRRHRLSRTDRALIAAQGKALTMLVTALQARGHIDVRDFAGTLAVFAVVVGEDNELEGNILAAWAGIMKESL